MKAIGKFLSSGNVTMRFNEVEIQGEIRDYDFRFTWSEFGMDYAVDIPIHLLLNMKKEWESR